MEYKSGKRWVFKRIKVVVYQGERVDEHQTLYMTPELVLTFFSCLSLPLIVIKSANS